MKATVAGSVSGPWRNDPGVRPMTSSRSVAGDPRERFVDPLDARLGVGDDHGVIRAAGHQRELPGHLLALAQGLLGPQPLGDLLLELPRIPRCLGLQTSRASATTAVQDAAAMASRCHTPQRFGRADRHRVEETGDPAQQQEARRSSRRCPGTGRRGAARAAGNGAPGTARSTRQARLIEGIGDVVQSHGTPNAGPPTAARSTMPRCRRKAMNVIQA